MWKAHYMNYACNRCTVYTYEYLRNYSVIFGPLPLVNLTVKEETQSQRQQQQAENLLVVVFFFDNFHLLLS